MKNNKSPSLDGFTVDFAKFFWVDIGLFYIEIIKSWVSCRFFKYYTKTGGITCIPKQNKSRVGFKTWRPILLLNATYKFAPAVIANRFKKVLDGLINENQRPFIAGRFLGENVRLIYDVLYECKIK